MACATERGHLLPVQIGRSSPDITKIQKKIKKKAFFYMPLLLAYILRFFVRFFIVDFLRVVPCAGPQNLGAPTTKACFPPIIDFRIF